MSTINISYTISFPQPENHYTKVSLHIDNVNQESIVLKMPVWTPGSYLIREFAKQVEREEAFNDKDKKVPFKKISKNSWQLNTKKTSSITFEYWVYCYELSVRTSFVDESHAFLNGANIFMYLEGYQNEVHKIKIEKPKNWAQISTSLSSVKNKPSIRIAANYDELVDSPIEIGNHEIWEFEAKGIPHKLAMYGDSNCNKETLIKDLKKITETSTELMGENPCKEYLFIIHNTDNKYGGLEHLFSTACHVPRWDYNPKDKYQKTLGLLCHEYFHLWNGKRIRPEELGPFNYESENYTRLLWVVEGFTSYYDDYILYKSGIFTRDEYLSELAKLYTQVGNQPGNDVQALTESSFDTWIKYYRQHENSPNNQVSYYGKGASIAIVLNILILEATNGTKSLDDLMRMLYKDYLSKPEKGYSESDITEALKKISGVDFKKFIQKHVEGTEPVNFEKIFLKVGLELKNKEASTTKKELGWKTAWRDGKLTITGLDKNYGAYQSGLNTDDEIISIDGFRVFDGFEKLFEGKKAGESLDIIVSRQGIIKTLKINITQNNKVDYSLTPTLKPEKKQKMLLKAWLGVLEN
jgi:predicted metalloprotease with PDZ domain